MVWNAYYLALVIWVPLLIFLVASRGEPPRAMLMPSIVVAALASAYEATIPGSANFRIDLLLVVPLLAMVHGFSGLALGARAVHLMRTGRPAMVSALAAALLVGVSLFVVAAWIIQGRETTAATAGYRDGRRFAFEAVFRDDATQRRVFGDLQGDADGWAGYYVAQKPDTYPRRIVINASGQYWTFWQEESMDSGRREPSPHLDRFVGKPAPALGPDPLNSVDLSREADGRIVLSRTSGDTVHAYGYVREAPPRFPRMASPSDRVKFKGVYSGFSASPRTVRVAQIWIWEADGKLWGKYLWQGGFTPGIPNEVLGPGDAQIDCAKPDCRQIVVREGQEQPVTLAWVSEDALEMKYVDAPGGKIVLKRGEVIPGFLYDLAPLATVEENRYWIRWLGWKVTWDVPAHGAAEGGQR